MMGCHPIWVLLRADRACWPRLEPVWSCWVSAPIGSHGWMVMARPSGTMVPGGGSADRGALPRCAATTGVAGALRGPFVRFNGRSARLKIFLRASQALTLPLPSSRLLRRVLLGLRGRVMQWLAGSGRRLAAELVAQWGRGRAGEGWAR